MGPHGLCNEQAKETLPVLKKGPPRPLWHTTGSKSPECWIPALSSESLEWSHVSLNGHSSLPGPLLCTLPVNSTHWHTAITARGESASLALHHKSSRLASGTWRPEFVTASRSLQGIAQKCSIKQSQPRTVLCPRQYALLNPTTSVAAAS